MSPAAWIKAGSKAPELRVDTGGTVTVCKRLIDVATASGRPTLRIIKPHHAGSYRCPSFSVHWENGVKFEMTYQEAGPAFFVMLGRIVEPEPGKTNWRIRK